MAFEIENGVLKKYREEDGVTEVVIPDSVTSIGALAFSYCTSLTSVTIPDSVTSIGEEAFSRTRWLEEYPEDLVIVGNGILIKYKGSDKKVTIPDSVTSIGYAAFDGCERLTKIKVSEKNTTYSDVDGVLFNKEKTEMLYIPEGKKSLTLPATYTVGGEVSFINITSVKFANGNTFKINSGDFAGVNESEADAWDMLLTNDFSRKFSHKLKYKLIIGYYLASDNEAAEAYIKKNALKIFRWLIDEDDIETLTNLLNTHKFVTKKNIDKLFDYAQEKDRIKIKVIILDYKNEHFALMVLTS